jgi:hypothetical protein
LMVIAHSSFCFFRFPISLLRFPIHRLRLYSLAVATGLPAAEVITTVRSNSSSAGGRIDPVNQFAG